MSSDFATIRAAIVTVLAGVPDIGRVHDRERNLTDANAIRLHYGWPANTPKGQKADVRGWFVRLREFSGVGARIGRGRRITTAWEIIGFIAFEDADASDLTVQALVQEIADRFEADPRLGGAVHRCAVGDGDEAPAGIQCESIVPVRLAGTILVHRVILSLPTQHFTR